MLVDLVRTQTADGIRLDGALEKPSSAEGHQSLDAAICLSGVGSNFYASTLIEHLAGVLRSQGIATLRVNTRGHDGVSTASTAKGGGQQQGAAYEIVDDCRHDIPAWVDYLMEQRYRRIGLLGHSLGAVKMLYAQAHQTHESVRRIIAISPPRLSYQRFLKGSQAASFRSSMRAAEQLVREQTPHMLFQATFPFPLVISAATFIDKYGPDERYNFLRFAPRIDCPLLFTFGEQELAEGSSAFADIIGDIDTLDWPNPGLITAVIPGANHFYAGRHQELAEAICATF